METKAATNQHATEHNLPDTITVLSRTPAALDALLRDLPDVWTRRNEGGDTWSVFDVIGHLIQGERTDWMPRAKIILQFGETRAFDPFDRLAQRRESAGKSLGQLLDEFDSLRAANLDELRTLKVTPEDLRRRGWHPALGGVTLSQLLATWAAHDFTHLHQVSRIMAHQYRAVVVRGALIWACCTAKVTAPESRSFNTSSMPADATIIGETGPLRALRGAVRVNWGTRNQVGY